MSEKDEVVLDSEKANIRRVGTSATQTIPARWLKRRDMANGFFKRELEIVLVLSNGRPIIVIRTLPKEEDGSNES